MFTQKPRYADALFGGAVRLVAVFTVGVILLLFVYIVRESLYAFLPEDSHTAGEVPVAAPKLAPQRYGGVARSDSTSQPGVQKTVSLESGQSVRFADLFFPNDTIDGAPAYIWQPVAKTSKFSVIPLLLGSLKVSLTAILIAFPIALLAALYTVVYAPLPLRKILKSAAELLAGFPTVVIGFFSLMILSGALHDLTGSEFRLNALVGGIGLSLAVIPIIFTLSEDALSSLPASLSEASLALGASRRQTAFRALLPAALPGIVAAFLLGFGRAVGETMIVLMATGNAPIVSADVFDSVRTITATIGAEMAEVSSKSVHYGVLFFLGSVLFVITFSINAFVELAVRKRLRRKLGGM